MGSRGLNLKGTADRSTISLNIVGNATSSKWGFPAPAGSSSSWTWNKKKNVPVPDPFDLMTEINHRLPVDQRSSPNCRTRALAILDKCGTLPDKMHLLERKSRFIELAERRFTEMIVKNVFIPDGDLMTHYSDAKARLVAAIKTYRPMLSHGAPELLAEQLEAATRRNVQKKLGELSPPIISGQVATPAIWAYNSTIRTTLDVHSAFAAALPHNSRSLRSAA